MLFLNETTLLLHSQRFWDSSVSSGIDLNWVKKVAIESSKTIPSTKHKSGGPAKSAPISTATTRSVSGRSTASNSVKAEKEPRKATSVTSRTKGRSEVEDVDEEDAEALVGGFDDEDETDERAAAHSSPIKAGKRATSTVHQPFCSSLSTKKVFRPLSSLKISEQPSG